MFYVTTEKSIDCIKEYILDKYGSFDYEVANLEELNKAINSSMSVRFKGGKPYLPSKIIVGEVKEELKIDCPEHVDAFLKVTKINGSISCPFSPKDVIRKKLDKMAFIMEQEAVNYLWDRFSDKPSKLRKELQHLVDLFKARKKILSLEVLKSMYEGEMAQSYMRLLGTPKGSRILSTLSPSERWKLFIGNENQKPLLYSYLVKRAPILWHFINANIDSYKDALGLDLEIRSNFNIDKKDKNNWKITRNG